MSSQAPGRASDMAEIAGLLAANKKIMVLLTGSDTTDEDEDEDGEIITTVVMKDPSDRRDQIAYVQSELEQLGNNDFSILAEVLPISISTRYAELNPTPEGMVASGMGQLLHELQNICHGPALDMKLNTPMDNLRSSIRSTAGELAEVRRVVENSPQVSSAKTATCSASWPNLAPGVPARCANIFAESSTRSATTTSRRRFARKPPR